MIEFGKSWGTLYQECKAFVSQQPTAPCQICGFEDETFDHLFLKCPFITAVWFNS